MGGQDVPVDSAGDYATGVCFALRFHQVGNVGCDCVYVECDHGAGTQNGNLFFDGKTLVDGVARVVVSRR
jgi:hypothetical protein